MLLRASIAFAALLLTSCGSVGIPTMGLKPYRMEIQQGNFVSQEMVSRLKPGMSQDQVRFVLGTPLITDSFHADRWDYVFRRQKANSNDLEQRKITVLFENGKLKRVEGDVKPAAGADATESQRAPLPATAAASAAKPDAAPGAPAPEAPQQKSWWQRLKEKF
ncbi:MAG: outer membrane protein assembly factor BamE [Burkholderiales bacterium]|nr:outer membrane protein assembly factor BamE [Burkholderiales bacterium]